MATERSPYRKNFPRPIELDSSDYISATEYYDACSQVVFWRIFQVISGICILPSLYFSGFCIWASFKIHLQGSEIAVIRAELFMVAIVIPIAMIIGYFFSKEEYQKFIDLKQKYFQQLALDEQRSKF